MDPTLIRGIPESVYCSLDKIDLAAEVDGRPVAIQTDHRSRAEVEAEPELSALYAMARVLNARSHLAEDGHPDGEVHYVVAEDPPPVLRDALCATGAVLEWLEPGALPGRAVTGTRLAQASQEARRAGRSGSDGPEASLYKTAGEVADAAFAELARRAARRVGSRDLAMALRMLEDQTIADPPPRTNEAAYWSRVLELAALTGELLRAKFPSGGRWVQTDRALVRFGFQLTVGGNSTIMFPTNRAQRVIGDGPDESLFKLLLAADETMARPPDATTGRLMPSLRDRRDVELDEVVWQALLADSAGPGDLPVVVCGVDGENTFGMIRRDAIVRTPDEAMAEALANLAAEQVQLEELSAGDVAMVLVSGSFYAAEKLLDHVFMRQLHRRLGAELLAAAVPMRGLLMVTAAHHEATQIARFAALARQRHDDAGGRSISPIVLLVSDGQIAGFVRDATHPDPPDTDRVRAATEPGAPKRAGFLRRLLNRKL